MSNRYEYFPEPEGNSLSSLLLHSKYHQTYFFKKIIHFGWAQLSGSSVGLAGSNYCGCSQLTDGLGLGSTGPTDSITFLLSVQYQDCFSSCVFFGEDKYTPYRSV